MRVRQVASACQTTTTMTPPTRAMPAIATAASGQLSCAAMCGSISMLHIVRCRRVFAIGAEGGLLIRPPADRSAPPATRGVRLRGDAQPHVTAYREGSDRQAKSAHA